MEDSDEFKWAVKVVIKRQMRDLMEQLRERGEEIAVLTVNLDDNTFSHFGSPSGEWFVSEQKNLAQNFLKFCRNKDKKGPSVESSPQKATGYSYSSTPGTKSSQKAKRTPASASSGGPTLTVTVPRHLAGDITEEELAAVVGRVVACQLAVQEKGDGSTSGTKFDLLLEAANQHKKKDENGSILSTPSTRSTRKRKLTAKYLEGMSSLKKGRRPEEEDTGSEQETGHDENVVLNMLEEISSSVLKRVKVKTSDETPVNIDKSHVRKTESLETLAVLIVQEIDEMAGGLLTKEKMIQVTVGIDEDNRVGSYIQIKVNGILQKFTNDPDFNIKIEMLDYEDGDSDMEEMFIEQANVEPEIETTSVLKKPPLGLQLQQRPRRRKRVLSKITPYPCEHCGKTLIGRGNLVAHVKRIHLKQRDHKCKICPKAFNTNSALESHVLAVHTRRCDNCQEYVIETEPWTEGMTMKSRRQVPCQCGELVDVVCLFGRRKVYEDDDEEVRERKRNYDPTKYACQHCGKLFASRSHCLRHARKHTGSKDIHCQYCQESFRYESSLKKHLASEHRIFQTHYCNVCKVEFDSIVELETHNKHFHGLKPTESRKLKSGPAESKLVKCTTKVITTDPNVKVKTPVPTANKASSASTSHHQESSSDIGTSLQRMLGTSQATSNPEVAMRTVGGHVLDKDTYDLVQQALQGDQIFTQDGNTIIIRTVPT